MTVEPTRTCVGCRERSPKITLLRLVRGPGGVVAVDRTGSAPGRGAYVHRRDACRRAALGDGVLARALRTGLGPNELSRLREQMETGAR